ncbi:ABC transporter substrate-binding protein [Paenibacillus abyssi]|uniref:ABC transporter substrate-binding protein n=1 Tax=Paenibacillus abyssi TaxID=1340531 RepID=A0A917FQY3_9BACL|nr:ABC transporter substrate-binding protein [Paenibacillus abyssi]GGG00709.1 ABC transporter substrate-binding protein [Paenibacillus abyssi]
MTHINRKHTAALFILMIGIAMMFTACSQTGGGSNSGASGADSEGNAAPAAGGEAGKVLKVRFYDDPSGFDPASVFRIENENIAFNVFSGLTTYDSESGQIIPDLAESWETEDNKTWTFHLRQGVQWQKGYGEFTSADVLYSYERILDSATASPYAAEFNNVESFEAPDDYTVVIRLKDPDSNFLHVVANFHQGQIVKKEAVEELGDQFKWSPVGTGPYMFDSMKVNSEIVLVRHEEYFRGPAPIEKIIFSIIKDDDTAAIALQNGEVDLVMRINRQEALVRLQDAGFEMNALYDRAVNVKMFNTSIKPLDDIRVRQAWAHAVDWTGISEATNPLLESEAFNLLPKWMDVYTENVPRYEYNPERAKELLKEAGFENGFTITQHLNASNGVTDSDQLEQEFLKAVGIDLQFELVDAAVYNQIRNKGEFEVAGRQLPAVNPDMILFSYLHPDNIAPKGLNGARYNNPELTVKLEAARAEIDPDKRRELYAEVQHIAMSELPYIPLYSANGYWPGYDYVMNVTLNPLSQVNFYEVDINK